VVFDEVTLFYIGDVYQITVALTTVRL